MSGDRIVPGRWIVCSQDPPVTRILRDKESRMLGIGGFFGEVIQLLQEGMNCT